MTYAEQSTSAPYQESSIVLAQRLSRHQGVLVAVAIAAAVFWTVFYLQFTVDDAYISFRYGKTLLQGRVWNWNPAGPPTEAYTSLLYTLLSIVPALLHISFPLFFKLLGGACMAALALRVWTESETRFGALLGILLLGLNPWVWIHAFSGLETPLYMLLIVEAGLCVKHAQTRSPSWTYALLLLLPLTRPEGFVLAIVAGNLYWRKRQASSKGGLALALAIAAGMAYFFLRWRYFHALLPNPFYVKVAAHTWHERFSALVHNLSWSKGYLLTLVSVFCLAHHRYVRVFAAYALLIILVLFAPHGMQMNYADRYWFQLAFPVLLLFLIVEDLALIPRTAALLAAVSLLTITARDLSTVLVMFPEFRSGEVAIGQRLAPFAAHHSLVVGDAGALPFYSGWFTYDYLGLCTGSVAHHGVTPSDLQQLHPDLVMLHTPGFRVDPSDLPDPNDPQQRILAYMKQSGDYEYLPGSEKGPGHFSEFLRKDTPQHDAILAALQASQAPAPGFSVNDLLLQRYVPWRD